MLKLPKGLKKKKKGKKSKRKGDDELFTEEELEKYRREHPPQEPPPPGAGARAPGPAVEENEEWSKFKHLTTGVDSVLKKTQGDLDRIKSTSFFQRVPAGAKQQEPAREDRAEERRVVQVTAADFPQLVQAQAQAQREAGGDAAPSDDDESEEDEQDDVFDTSYVEAAARGEVRLALVPDSPDEPAGDDVFDTSHVDALIKGQDARTRGKKALDIGVAVEVLTGRIGNVTVTTKRPKRVIPGDLLLDSSEEARQGGAAPARDQPPASILDADADDAPSAPIDLSVSLHAALLQRRSGSEQDDELDEFALLAAESLEASADVVKVVEKDIILEPVLQESWSAFEANKNESVFAECIVEDQIDVVDPYVDQDDPFDTSFADAVVPATQSHSGVREAIILEDDDDFDPRAEEFQARLNNRRKSSVRIHLTDPSGVRESITSDDLAADKEPPAARDLLGGSATDLTQLGDSPLDPVGITDDADVDPFDTTIVDKIVAPGKVELKLLEEELIGARPAPAAAVLYRAPSDPEFDPRADEPRRAPRRETRRASRPENLVVVFDVHEDQTPSLDIRARPAAPVTPYYTRELSISEESESESPGGAVPRARSIENLCERPPRAAAPRRHSAFPAHARALQPALIAPAAPADADPFDTSFTGDIVPSKTELKLLAKEFSCEESTNDIAADGRPDLLDPSDDIFQAKALTPEPPGAAQREADPFDTSFAGDLHPGRTELKLLESEFLD